MSDDLSLPIPLTEAEAKQLTFRIQLRLGVIADNTEAVVPMIEQARTGDAHEALGYKSWPAYVEAEFGGQLKRLDQAERRPLVSMLSDSGMSTRAIAGTVGVSKNTVTSDLQVSQIGTPEAEPEPRKTTGLDGKSYVRNGKPTAKGMQQLADAVPPVKQRRPPRPADPEPFGWDRGYKSFRVLAEFLTKDSSPERRARLANCLRKLLKELSDG